MYQCENKPNCQQLRLQPVATESGLVQPARLVQQLLYDLFLCSSFLSVLTQCKTTFTTSSETNHFNKRFSSLKCYKYNKVGLVTVNIFDYSYMEFLLLLCIANPV